MTPSPFVSIIIVNFNGCQLLKECLPALMQINYPKSKYEIILVDNNSWDDSVDYVTVHFPKVRLIKANSNNLGLQHARGELIALLNSDVKVDSNWLKYLVLASLDPQVGLVSSKLLLATPFIELEINSDSVSKSELDNSTDFSPRGVRIEDIVCQTEELSSLVWYKSGFYDEELSRSMLRSTRGQSKVLLPFANSSEKETYLITAHGFSSTKNLSTFITISLGQSLLVNHEELKANQVKQYKLNISRRQVKSKFIWLVQNAGNNILRSGLGKDRGSLIKKTKYARFEFYEEDSGYFNQSVQLLAICGASCLIKKEVIDQIGFLDGYYFMYYEDLDFSLRAWKMGWNIVYEPRSVVFHNHRSTTKNNSDQVFMSTLIERNHLLFTFSHFPIMVFLTEFVAFLLRLLIAVIIYLALYFRENIKMQKVWLSWVEHRWQATIFIVSHVSLWVRNKSFWQSAQVRFYRDFEKYLY